MQKKPTFNCSIGCPSTYYGGADNGANVFNLYDNFEGYNTSNGLSSNNIAIDAIFKSQDALWTL